MRFKPGEVGARWVNCTPRSLTLFSLFLNFSLFAVPRNSRNRQEDRFLDEYWDETDPHDTHSGCETISKVVRMDFATF